VLTSYYSANNNAENAGFGVVKILHMNNPDMKEKLQKNIMNTKDIIVSGLK
jgi:phosphoribosylcarboxyaminoimidazole (NCAIR) mutase